jgi:PAS domain S-box-containing protein
LAEGLEAQANQFMSTTSIIYISTTLVSIVIAFLLVHLTRLSGQAKLDEERKRMENKVLSPQIVPDASLKQTVLEEVSQWGGSEERGERLSERVTEIFNKELEKSVNNYAQELTKQYKNVIDEKTQNEEIAWKKYEKVLGEKKETEAVIRSVAEGLVVVDAKGRVVMMNPAAERLLDVSRKEKIGKSILDQLKENQMVSLIKNSPSKEYREIELISQQDETKKVLRESSAVIENENGQPVGMVAVLSDITKQKELDRLKSTFVANVSHELRTPLVAIQKSISLILGRETGPITPTQEQFLSIADRNLTRLSRLIEDLLSLSKLEAGKVQLNRQPHQIGQVIQDTVDARANWVKTKGINLEVSVPEGLPEVNVDSDKIIQVLTNLIGNAIKFTPNNGKIIVGAALSKEENAITASVADNGIGIPKEHLGKIFDKFYQVGERVATDIGGTGIGLSVAKEIVEIHGGRIWVESEHGSGAKFIFTLPLNK